MFNLPNFPTDNLYKFKFLSGIFLLVFAAYLYSTQLNSSYDKLILANVEVEKYKIQTEILTRDLKLVDGQLSSFKDDSIQKIENIEINLPKRNIDELKNNLLNDKNYRDYLGFVFSHKDDLFQSERNIKEIKKIQSELKNITSKMDESRLNSALAIIKSQFEFRKFIVTTIITTIMGLFGISISKKGYKDWNELVQKPIDEKLKEELIKIKKENI